MFDRYAAEPDDADLALRSGLRGIPVPPVSADFDARVFQQLVRPEPLMARILASARGLRPALAAASLTVPCVLLAVMWLSQPSANVVAAPASSARTAEALPVDQALDRPDLTPATLRRLSRQEAAVRARSGRIASRITAA
jgi:hypothetical protein